MYPNCDFLFENKPSGNPGVPRTEIAYLESIFFVGLSTAEHTEHENYIKAMAESIYVWILWLM
jgi:hypothetical protein